MKNILFFLTLSILSCQPNLESIDGKILLKNLNEEVFQKEQIHTIQLKDAVVNFQNTFTRLPNSEFSKFHLKKHPETYEQYFNITINLSVGGKITLDGTPNDEIHLHKDIIEFIDFAAGGKQTMIHLNFDENVSFESFYHFMLFIQPLESKNVLINNKLFIYNIKNLPDCDCSL